MKAAETRDATQQTDCLTISRLCDALRPLCHLTYAASMQEHIAVCVVRCTIITISYAMGATLSTAP